ncbi:MAG: dienelactone hydrolase family protein [Pyrinomonadaceae bacterium]|nr:dienelactone hydrolase family protein [Pyrinomonadaceae bacterium]
MITIRSSEGEEFAAYLALPSGPSGPSGGKGPGLVLLQEIFGVNRDMRAIADWYAARGFVVACPDLFWRQEPGVQLTDQSDEEWQHAMELYRGLDEAKAVADAAATLAFLHQHPACTGKVGTVGFCLGGKLAYLLATRSDPDCSVAYYGVGIESALAEAGRIGCPTMLHMAGRDQFCPPSAQAQIHQVLDTHPLITLHVYAEQDHAFARVGGAHFDAQAAELAHLRTLEFLVHHLGGSAATNTAQRLSDLWDEHVKYEFATRSTEDTLATMVEDAYVNHVPVLTGGIGHDQLREFYSQRFIPQMPPDTSMTPVSRTVGIDRVVDEMVFEFTHTIKMDWMLPGLAPTGKHVKVPLVVIVHFRDGKLAHEHIYWDQASVLAQLGLVDADKFPIAGVESAEKVLDPSLPANALMKRD